MTTGCDAKVAKVSVIKEEIANLDVAISEVTGLVNNVVNRCGDVIKQEVHKSEGSGCCPPSPSTGVVLADQLYEQVARLRELRNRLQDFLGDLDLQ